MMSFRGIGGDILEVKIIVTNTVREVLHMFLYNAVYCPFGPLKALYISPPGRPVHSHTNLTCCSYWANTISSHISITVYSQVQY